MTHVLNHEQEIAVASMLTHARTVGDDPFLVLEGPAGTGKTFTTAYFNAHFKRRVLWTAPTNKAVRVLREALTSPDYKPECKTIYSALGLQMAAKGEIKELAKSEDKVDLNQYAVIVIDEGSMVGKGNADRKGLWPYLLEAAKDHPRVRWIIMGDPFQLPPVGESLSPVWDLPKKITLTKVMRQDNQILTLAEHLRLRVAAPFGALLLNNDNDGEEGVWKVSNLDQAIMNHIESFSKGTESKAIAWRNVEVDRLNRMIRERLFEDAAGYPWQPGDRMTLLGPAKDLEGELVGTTDEEGVVEKVDIADHPNHGLKCYRIVMRSDMNNSMTLWALHPEHQGKFTYRKARLAETARIDKSQWGAFWEFVEAFHPVRHAYAITAHRAQGSTYTRAFVSWRDILMNQDRAEALRCLYVASSRPRKELYLG